MSSFEFATAARIIFGNGKLTQIGAVAAEHGTHALVVTGRTVDRAAPLLKLLDAADVMYTTFAIPTEPTVERVQQGVETLRSAECDLVIGFGGGSAIDAAKAIAALATNPGEPLDYLEVIGKGQKLSEPPLPCIAIPTTSGTGAEVTRNAVLASKQHRVKVSLRSPLMLPDVALVDPELTLSLPPKETALTGMDALTQVIEPYVSIHANPLTDAICREGIVRAASSLRRVYTHPDDIEARENMALASLFGGLALANSKLGAVHGFAGPLGGMFDAPHGGICAALLPIVTRANVQALQQRDPAHLALVRYTEIAQWLTGDLTATIEDGVLWLQETLDLLQIPALGTYGIAESDFDAIIDKSMKSSSMKGNAIVLDENELASILQVAL
jgi:alcohol dehydrogenase class IV